MQNGWRRSWAYKKWRGDRWVAFVKGHIEFYIVSQHRIQFARNQFLLIDHLKFTTSVITLVDDETSQSPSLHDVME